MTFVYRAISVLALLLTLPAAVPAQTLSPELAILAPLAGKTWVGRMTAPDGQRTFTVERTFEVMGDGSALRFSTKAEIGSPSEGYYYWDREAKQVAVFIVSGRGVYQRGTVSVRDGVITVEGRISFPERAFDYRNTYERRPDGTLVDRWFQNAFGDWRPGHVVELKAREEAAAAEKAIPPMADAQTTVLDVYDTIASAKTTTGTTVYYWQALWIYLA